MFDKYIRAHVGKKARVDDVYRYCMRQAERVVLGMRLGVDAPTGLLVKKELWESYVDKWAGHIQDEIRKLNESGSVSLLRLPQA